MTKGIYNNQDVIDLRDVTDRFEELEGTEMRNKADEEEFQTLTKLLDDLRGNGGDHDWRGNWYPLSLVRDSYFEGFAHDEADSLGLIDNEASWPYTCIDWERAAEQLQMDYSSVEFDDETYWYR